MSPILRSDPTHIRQILFNLISNAEKFTAAGGITLDISQIVLTDGAVESRVKATDSGIGLAPETKEFIFSMFTQVDSSTTHKYGGSGLGLAICS